MKVSKNADDIMALLDRWVLMGWMRELDRVFACFLQDVSPEADPLSILLAALTSRQLGEGHVCLDLEVVVQDPDAVLAIASHREKRVDVSSDTIPRRGDFLEASLSEILKFLGALDLHNIEDRLIASKWIGRGEGNEPLVLDGHRLYLRRYWHYEHQIEHAIRQRMARSDEIAQGIPETRCQKMLEVLFQKQDPAVHADWQKMACALAARSAFCVITGGPGTGKTTTVVRLLALLQALSFEAMKGEKNALRIGLAAPTGKAAARLRTSIAHAIDLLPEDALGHPGLKKYIPNEVVTLHRLLGTRPGTRQFRHDAHHPLLIDVLVVDEASMIDLEMMASVLQALPEQARLILLGDKDQLASVEAGAVLGRLCHRAATAHYLPATVQWLERMCHTVIHPDLQDESGTALDQHVVMLRDSFRFDQKSGIGRLALAVNEGNVPLMRQIGTQNYADLACISLNDLEDARLESVLLGGAEVHPDKPSSVGLSSYLLQIKKDRPALDAQSEAFDTWARSVLEAQARFQLLCALRNGPYGVRGLNERIEQILKRKGLVAPDEDPFAENSWYEGRPVLVTRNEYALGLMNGDIGVTLSKPTRRESRGELRWERRVAFLRNEGDGVHWVLPSRLTAVESVYALTVHKSQGSEFEHCVLLLPPGTHPVLTRELIYTGITRARRLFTQICVDEGRSMEEAAGRQIRRSGGLHP